MGIKKPAQWPVSFLIALHPAITASNSFRLLLCQLFSVWVLWSIISANSVRLLNPAALAALAADIVKVTLLLLNMALHQPVPTLSFPD